MKTKIRSPTITYYLCLKKSKNLGDVKIERI